MSEETQITKLPKVKELLADMFHIQSLIDTAHPDTDRVHLNELYNELDEKKQQAIKKTQNLKYVIAQKDAMKAAIKAEITVFSDYIKQHKQKLNAIERCEEWLKDSICDLVFDTGEIMDNENIVLQTDNAKFTVYTAPGKVEITNQGEVPEKYIKISKTFDIAGIRRMILNSGNGDHGFAKIENITKLKMS
jgi:IS30 family transposase